MVAETHEYEPAHQPLDRLPATPDPVGRERGAGLVEYAMLIAFIVLVCVAAIALVGDSTAEPFSSVLAGFS